ncbi:unnamed protein product [Closterium sp. NIES-54]
MGERRAVGGEEAWLSGRQAGCGREMGGDVRSESTSVWTSEVVCSTSHGTAAAATTTATDASAAGARETGAAVSSPSILVSWVFARPSTILSAATGQSLLLPHTDSNSSEGSNGSNSFFTLQLQRSALRPPFETSQKRLCQTDGTPSHATVSPTSLPTHDWSNFRWPSSSPSPPAPADDGTAAGGATGGASAASAAASAAAAGMEGRVEEQLGEDSEQWRVDVVQREIDMCRELIELEPDSREGGPLKAELHGITQRAVATHREEAVELLPYLRLAALPILPSTPTSGTRNAPPFGGAHDGVEKAGH